MHIVGVGLVKVYEALLRLARVHSAPFRRLSEAFSVLFHCNKNSALLGALSGQAWSLILKLNFLLQKSGIQSCSL